MFFFFIIILFSFKAGRDFLPRLQNPRCVYTQAHACARMAHTGTFRQTNVSLAGVKLVARRSLCV